MLLIASLSAVGKCRSNHAANEIKWSGQRQSLGCSAQLHLAERMLEYMWLYVCVCGWRQR